SGPIKVLGEHPGLGGKVEVLSGRYGPYIKHGAVNATLPKGTAPEAVTMEEAVRLIAARIESGGGTKKRPAGKAAKSKAVTVNGKGAKGKAPKSGKAAKPAAAKRTSKAASEAP